MNKTSSFIFLWKVLFAEAYLLLNLMLFVAAVPETDVCFGSGSGRLGKPIWPNPRFV